uniref:Uncharacterized protein n=1 Tax=Romanomermis culicivorax TaxID=13658 RepID=A0A915KBU3_ROMCU
MLPPPPGLPRPQVIQTSMDASQYLSSVESQAQSEEIPIAQDEQNACNHLFEALGLAHENKGNNINILDYKTSHCSFGFDLTSDEDNNGQWDLIQDGATNCAHITWNAKKLENTKRLEQQIKKKDLGLTTKLILAVAVLAVLMTTSVSNRSFIEKLNNGQVEVGLTLNFTATNVWSDRSSSSEK